MLGEPIFGTPIKQFSSAAGGPPPDPRRGASPAPHQGPGRSLDPGHFQFFENLLLAPMELLGKMFVQGVLIYNYNI